MWAKLASGSSVNTFRIDLTNVLTTTYASSSSATLNSSTWTKFTVTGTTPSPQQLAISFVRVTGNTNLTVHLAGAMIVNSATAPDYFNCGVASLLEDITGYWGGGKWGLGFVKPYQYVAPVGKADLTLMNSDKRFSPEYSSGDLYGMLLPNLLLQIGDPDYGIWWTGWVDSWAPEPGTNRDKKAKLHATDARRFMANKIPVLPLYNLEIPQDTISNIIDEFSVPNTTSGISNSPSVSSAWDSISTGIIASLYADNVPYDHDAVKVLGDILGSLQGHLWFTRVGTALFATAQGDDTPASYVDIAQNWLDMGYETGMIVNKCEAIAHKRKLQSSGPYTVWESDDVPFSIAGLSTEVFRVFFKYDTTRKEVVGALSLSVTETNSGVAGDITAALSDTGAQSTVITFTNNNAASRDVTAASLSATSRVVQLREISKEYEDSASITANGTQAERLDFQYTQERAWSKRLARYRVTRFKDARYEVPWVEMDADKHPQDVFDCEIGAAVHITDDQTGHDDYYAVVGEQHTVRDGLTNHTVKLFLEPLYPTTVANTSSA